VRGLGMRCTSSPANSPYILKTLRVLTQCQIAMRHFLPLLHMHLLHRKLPLPHVRPQTPRPH